MSSSSTREPVLADQQGFIAVYPQGVVGPDGRTEKKDIWTFLKSPSDHPVT
jgi:hypothetical protein